MNRNVFGPVVALSLFALPVAAADFITKVGDYMPTPTTSVRVYEENGKIQYRVKSGSKTGGPTKPLIDKGTAWFIFPENERRVWISPAQGQLELMEFTDDGIKFSSSDVRRNLADRAPAAVQERLKQPQKNGR